MSRFSFVERQSNLQRLQNETFDLLVIGGGISGAGVARDAASRGMKVALVEAHDFASGTSSRSSKLIHGGIRYLENLEFGLVFEALRERRNLFDMAPHLVHPLRFALPIYKGSRVGMFKLGLGMWLYDALSMFEAPKFHERLSTNEMMERIPMLESKNLLGGYVYSDAYMDDDRLVLETLRSAHGFGAVAVNYTKAVDADLKEGKLHRVKVRDEKSQNEFWITARHFVSTVGPWTDMVANDLLKQWKNRMRPSKGVHLTFDRKRIPLQEAVVMVSDDEKRIVFGIPRHEMVIIGTTDTDYQGDPGDVYTTREDVEYLLHITSEYFPNAAISEADILSSYSGVRPLVDDGSATESKTSREHLILSDPRNITFLTGGKYTTYRQMAEDTLTEVLQVFSFDERMRWSKSKTLRPLNPKATTESIMKTKVAAPVLARRFDVSEELVKTLAERHGEEAVQILESYAAHLSTRNGATRNRAASLWSLEAHHAIHQTMCLHLRDFFLRRSPLFLSRADHGFTFAGEMATLFQKVYGWPDEQRKQEIESLHQHLAHEMGWRTASRPA